MDPALHTESPVPTRPRSGLNTSAVIAGTLSAIGALGSAALFLTPLADALSSILSWMILLVVATCEFLWSVGAVVGLVLAGLSLFRRASRTGAIVPAIVCLLLLIGYVFFARMGPSLFFG